MHFMPMSYGEVRIKLWIKNGLGLEFRVFLYVLHEFIVEILGF